MYLKVLGIIILIIGIVIGVFLALNPQVLRSRADGGNLLTSFLASFGSNAEEERYDYSLDINADGVINIIDILESRKLAEDEVLEEENLDTENSEITGSEETTKEE